MTDEFNPLIHRKLGWGLVSPAWYRIKFAHHCHAAMRVHETLGNYPAEIEFWCGKSRPITDLVTDRIGTRCPRCQDYIDNLEANHDR